MEGGLQLALAEVLQLRHLQGRRRASQLPHSCVRHINGSGQAVMSGSQSGCRTSPRNMRDQHIAS